MSDRNLKAAKMLHNASSLGTRSIPEILEILDMRYPEHRNFRFGDWVINNNDSTLVFVTSGKGSGNGSFSGISVKEGYKDVWCRSSFEYLPTLLEKHIKLLNTPYTKYSIVRAYDKMRLVGRVDDDGSVHDTWWNYTTPVCTTLGEAIDRAFLDRIAKLKLEWELSNLKGK